MTTPTDRLLRRTRRRLFAVTLALVALLVVGVGAATALVAIRSLDADVDRSLQAAVDAQVAALDGSETITKEEGEDGTDGTEHLPAAADTVLLVLDPAGAVVLRPTGTIAGLPDHAAVAAAETAGTDLRTISAGGREIRVYTRRVDGEDGAAALGYVQGGFVLTLHERQSRTLLLAILATAALGLLAAALITLLVTGRALIPIRESFDAQRRFVADASHELRTPAALIRANAEVLQREGLVAEDGRDLLEDVIAEADRLGGLVGDLLALAAWDETRLRITPAPLDLAETAQDTVRGAQALAAERGITLLVDDTALGGRTMPVEADRARIVQLLLILLDNAVDHSTTGGRITVRLGSDGGWATVDVDDEGPGIAAEDRERIFEPFTRLPGTTRHGSGGTGLGLAIGRRIAEAHGGTVAAGVSPEGGARFTVRLLLRQQRG